MRQVLRIFGKDVRHSWREGAASVALLIAFWWYEIGSWTQPDDMAFSFGGLFAYRFLAGLLVVLVPVAWWLVVVRVIQSESLVGDRQFWVTRPYEWKKLLAAKALFVVAFIDLPLLLLDVFLLAKAGFPPAQHVAGLLWMQLLIVLFFLLPMAALATVTASVAQVLLALLLIALYMVGMAYLANLIPSASFSWSSDWLSPALLIGACMVVILLQYSRRKTAASRWLITGLAGALVLILVATPYRTLIARDYPRLGAGQQPPVQLSPLPPEKFQSLGHRNEDEVEIRLPLSVSGISPDSLVNVQGSMITIEAPGGVVWNSGWKSQGLFLFPGQGRTQVDFALKKSTFERMKSLPVKVRIALAVTLFHDTNRRELVIPQGRFALEGVGLCSTEGGYSRRMHCLAPLRRPSFLLVTSDLSATTCPVLEGESRAPAGEIARGALQNGDSGPAEFGISPVKTFDLYLSIQNDFSKRRAAGLCPGTPVVLSNPVPVRRNQTALEVNGIRLSDYQL